MIILLIVLSSIFGYVICGGLTVGWGQKLRLDTFIERGSLGQEQRFAWFIFWPVGLCACIYVACKRLVSPEGD
jgi:hypothetical protein